MKKPILHLPNITRRHVFDFLDVLKTLLLLILLAAFVNFNIQLGREVQSTKAIATEQTKTLSTLLSVSKQRTNQIMDLQTHIDCLFKLATTPHTTTSPPAVTNLSTCDLTATSSPGGAATGATKSGD